MSGAVEQKSPALVIDLAQTNHDYAWCIHIRTLVFVVEQKCPANIEIDAHENDCRHVLVRDDQTPCATGRWRTYDDRTAKIERVAVLPAWRGRGVGFALMRHMIDDIGRAGLTSIKLGAQDTAVPFYEKLGFAVVGDGFLDAGIPHHWMLRGVR